MLLPPLILSAYSWHATPNVTSLLPRLLLAMLLLPPLLPPLLLHLLLLLLPLMLAAHDCCYFWVGLLSAA
jgi:hypothetical protein